MLKQRRTVKEPEPVRISGEMRGHPIHDDADALLMCPVDEIHQLFRLAIARRRCIVARHLIAPARVVGIFHQRHDLDMGISHVCHVVNQLVRKFAIAQPLFPTAEAYLIDIHRLRVGIPRFIAAFQIPLVRPFIIGHVPNDGCGSVRFRAEGERVGLQDHLAGVGSDGVFIQIAKLRNPDGNLPNAGGSDTLHRVCLRVPEVKRANHADRLRVRCPNGKAEHPLPVFANAFVATKLEIGGRGNATVEIVECGFVRKSAHQCNPRVYRCEINVFFIGFFQSSRLSVFFDLSVPRVFAAHF
ncbi:hypothetical protein SDC9_128135 [bioreactor metagenome]|uniref:Uncharacterized protein n=1 Tax=bioreactor metagenome TaxID=1076179 RepID=A0A645CW30_9ZZZZ